MIKIVMLTGFLGSGKTTLMQLLLSSFEETKCGVIVNDFGKINVDAKLLKNSKVEMMELSNGSIFCACIKDNFVESLVEMSKMDIEYLFIEASGLADPSNMSGILSGINTATNGNLEMKGNVCIVDATNIIGMIDMFVSVQRQLEQANAIIVNKMDLINENEIDDIMSNIREYNETAIIYPTSYCSVDVNKVLSNLVCTEVINKETTNKVENRPFVVVLNSFKILDYNKITKLIQELAVDSYRIKGFVKTDNGNIILSSVLENTKFEAYDEDINKSEIVLISRIGIKHLNKINKLVSQYFGKDISVDL